VSNPSMAGQVYIRADRNNYAFARHDVPATASVCRDPESPGKCRRTYNDFCHQPCSICGLTIPKSRPPGRVMVAHHRDPATKRHAPSELSRRSNKWWFLLIEELRKCEPLCATCHAAVHDVMGSYGHCSWDAALRVARDDVLSWQAGQ